MSFGGSRPEFGERAEYGPGDVCYRHPDRPSFTLCQRCGRTICGECQVTSAVGVLCPECMRDMQPSTAKRAARSSRATARRLSDPEFPVVSYGIMIVCAVVFAAQMLGVWFLTGSNGGVDPVTGALWYAPVFSLPSDVSGMVYADVSFEPWRMLTVMFTHSTGFLLHILFNMYALWLFGRNLEQMIGRVQFLVLYLLSGLGGSLAVMLWGYFDGNSIGVPTVGASGAIFGVLAATLVAYRAARVNITSLAVLIGINFAIGLVPGANVSWQAHLGGLLVGALTMWLLLANRGPRNKRARQLSLIGVTVGLVALSCLYLVVLPPVPWLV